MKTDNNSLNNLFLKSKQTIAISAAIFALVGASAVSASGIVVQSLNNNQITPAFF
ncbi:MAG: hypothetical protein ACI9N3_002503 [Colwellia sp.]|jgi:hypothetical protein